MKLNGEQFVVTMVEWPDGNLRNIIHTSDNVNSATREIGIWFPEFDIKDKQ